MPMRWPASTVPRESSVLEARRRLRAAHTPRRPPPRVPHAPLRVVDVAVLRGERGAEVRAYLDAKAAWAQASALIEYHVIVRRTGDRDVAGLRATLRALQPDVVLLHDPLCRPRCVTQTARALGAQVVAVHHRPIAHDAADLAGPDALWQPILRAWTRRAYHGAHAVMAATDTRADCGRPAVIDLRLGLHPAYVPQPHARRQDHVLHVGGLGRHSGVVELLHAAARSAEPWQLKLVGQGPERRLRRLAAHLGIAERVRFYPAIAEHARLARWYASARAVVAPAPCAGFGLRAVEAAASGACVVTCSTTPSTALLRGLVRTYEPGDLDGLLSAIDAARASRPGPAAAAGVATRFSWGAAFAAETLQLERLAGRHSPRPLTLG